MGSPFRLDRVGADGHFKLSGEVDMAVADRLVELLTTSLDGTRDVTLDLRDLCFIDSSGIRALIRISQSLRGRGRLILEAPRGVVDHALQIIGIEQLPEIEVRPGSTSSKGPTGGASS